eukprot:gene3753-4673_t
MSKIDCKIVMLGTSAVGKTCLVQRYMYQSFSDTTATIGGAFVSKRVTLSNTEIVLGIWDTAGADRYKAINRSYYRRAAAAIVCFDLTSPTTLENVVFWCDELLANEPNADIYLVGTKVDLVYEGMERVSQMDIEKIGNKYHARIFEVSSRTGENVDQLFNTVAENFYNKGIFNSGETGQKLTSQSQQKKSDCSC